MSSRLRFISSGAALALASCAGQATNTLLRSNSPDAGVSLDNLCEQNCGGGGGGGNYKYTFASEGSDGSTGAANYNELTAVVVSGKAANGSSILSGNSSGTFAANGSSYTSTHNWSVSGGSTGALTYATPVTQPGQSATTTFSNGRSYTAGYI
jgi:hypothetical protein